jgi:glycine cleavage system pyridoxal-binding protein P
LCFVFLFVRQAGTVAFWRGRVLNEPSGGFGSPGAGPRGESELLQEFRSNLQQKNKLLRSFIGMGYYGTITPAVIQRYIYIYQNAMLTT